MSSSPPPIVLGFVGENANATLAASTANLNNILGAHRIEAHIVDTRTPDWSQRLGHFINTRSILFGYGYAGVGSVLRNGEQSFWTAYKTPFLSLMYDHPFYNLPNHTVDSPYVANCYFVPDFAEIQKNYVKNPHSSFIFRDAFLANSNIRPTKSEAERKASWRDRKIPYLFVKEGRDPAMQNADIATLDRSERQVFHECLETLQRSSDHVIADLVAFRSQYMSFSRTFSQGTLIRISVLLDRYIRDWRSSQVAEWLKSKPAVIIGDGWDFIEKTNTAAQFFPSRPFHEIAPLYHDSRFAFNANPYSRDGYHERVMMALNAGAVAVSDRNRFSDQYFSSLKNFVGFDWGDTDWREKLATRLAEIEKSSGGFDPTIAQKHLETVFPTEPFIANILNAAAEIRRRNTP